MLNAMDVNEFSHLNGAVYLDHAGATLYANSQLKAVFDDLSTNLYGNPHSSNPSSKLSSEAIERSRDMILNHFNTDSDSYHVVFTSNCTSALSLLSEIFPWNQSKSNLESKISNTTDTDLTKIANTKSMNADSELTQFANTDSELTQVANTDLTQIASTDPASSPQSIFCYLEDNHTSVLGMRETAHANNTQLLCITEHSIRPTGDKERSHVHPTNSPYHLFAYPAQSNFSGIKYPLNWINQLENGEVAIDDLVPPKINGTWLVLLDAASFASTNHLDLTLYPAHFVALSFYKLFGYPTGLGALLVRSDVAHLLRGGGGEEGVEGGGTGRRYFGGGTVLISIARERYHLLRPLPHERYEDGTVSFLSIAALRHGFDTLNRFNLNMETVSKHTFHLAQLTYQKMTHLRHENGRALAVLYGKTDYTDRRRQGGIVTFNLLRSNGSYIGYSEVDKMACVYNIHLRTGCFCNPGACQAALGLTCGEIKANMKAGHTCGDDIDLINGRPTGCVRVSFGYMSTINDVNAFIDFITNSFIESSSDMIGVPLPSKGDNNSFLKVNNSIPPNLASSSLPLSAGSSMLRVGSNAKIISPTSKANYLLEKILLYPVKSCGGFEVEEWCIGDRGLVWDREWMILNERRACLSQKQEPKLALIKPCIDMESGTLTLKTSSDSFPPLQVSPLSPTDAVSPDTQCKANVCGDKVQGLDAGDEAAAWLSEVLKRDCRLIQMSPKHLREAKGHKGHLHADRVDGIMHAMGFKINCCEESERAGILTVLLVLSFTPCSSLLFLGSGRLSLSNEGQFLLLTKSSLTHLHAQLNQKELSLDSLTLRFRPNLVLKSNSDTPSDPFQEDEWETLSIGDITFKVVGNCTRCQMICVDQGTGIRSKEPLQTLLRIRGSKTHFGIYLQFHKSSQYETLQS